MNISIELQIQKRKIEYKNNENNTKAKGEINMDFTGKNIIVTGGASGIGKAIVTGVVEGGGHAIIVDLNLDAAEKLREDLGKVMLAHVASAQGEVAAENALGENAVYNGATNPSCVYTDPEFAGVGLTEEKAKEMGIAYQVGKFPLMANGKSLIMNGGVGSIKFIIGTEYKEVLGVHILGPRATDLIGECALAIGMEATVEDIIAAIHAHPTVTEAVREAALAAEKRAIHIPNK